MAWTSLELNDKYREWLLNSFNSTYNVLEGSWRSGKTTTLLLSHILYLDDLDVSGLHIVAGESISTARTILLNNPNGFGYLDFFAERSEQKQYEGKDALLITNSRGKKQILVFVGSSKSNSWQSIRGLTAMSVFITEANISHKSFLQESIGRTISTPVKYRRMFFDLNPKSSKNWFYTEFLDVWESKHELGELKLNFMRTTYWDNPALTEQQKKEITLEYDPESLLYRIYILGERISQADHVYLMRPYNIIDAAPEKPNEYVISVDVGVSASATTFVTMGYKDNQLSISNSYYHKNGREIEGPDVKDAKQYAEDLADYYEEEFTRYGFAPTYIYVDRDIAFLRIATEVFRSRNLPHNLLHYAIKETIDERIKNTGVLLYQAKLVIQKDQQLVIDAFTDAVYDSKKLDEQGKLDRLDVPNADKKIFNPIDLIDACEYAVSHFIRRHRNLLTVERN